jgi:hypothetical protein
MRESIGIDSIRGANAEAVFAGFAYAGNRNSRGRGIAPLAMLAMFKSERNLL